MNRAELSVQLLGNNKLATSKSSTRSLCCVLQAIDFVRERLLEGQSVKYISESVCDHCLAKDTGGNGIGCDNMSMMVVVFKRFTQFHKAQAARFEAMTSDLHS